MTPWFVRRLLLPDNNFSPQFTTYSIIFFPKHEPLRDIHKSHEPPFTSPYTIVQVSYSSIIAVHQNSFLNNIQQKEGNLCMSYKIFY